MPRLQHLTPSSLTQVYQPEPVTRTSHQQRTDHTRNLDLFHGTETQRVNHFVANYCNYFRDYCSLSSPARASVQVLKTRVDSYLRQTYANYELHRHLNYVFSTTPKPTAETVAFWVEAGATPNSDTLNAALRNHAPLKAIRLLLAYVPVSSETIITAINNQSPRPVLDLLIQRAVKDNVQLSPEVLVASISNNLKLGLLKLGAPPSHQAISASIRNNQPIADIEYLLIAYLKHTEGKISSQDKEIALASMLRSAVSSKYSPEVVTLLCQHGAKICVDDVIAAIHSKQPLSIITSLVDELIKNSPASSLDGIFNQAAVYGYETQFLSELIKLGATPSLATLNAVLLLRGPISLPTLELILEKVTPTEEIVVEMLSRKKPTPENIKVISLLIQKVPTFTNNAVTTALKNRFPMDPIIKAFLQKGAVATLGDLDLALENEFSLEDVKALNVKPTDDSLYCLVKQRNPSKATLSWMLEQGVKLDYITIRAAVSEPCEIIGGKKPKSSFVEYLLKHNFDLLCSTRKENQGITLYDEILLPAITNGFSTEAVSLILASMSDKNGPSIASLKAARQRYSEPWCAGMYGIVSRKSIEVYGPSHLMLFHD